MDIKRIVIVSLVCLAVVTAVLLFVETGHAQPTLKVHAGAGIRPALNELGKLFEEKTGVRVEYSYKGSGCLLADICFSRKGDVYIPGELFYVKQAEERGFIHASRVVAQMTTVILVQPGNPKGVRGLKDLARPGLRVGIGDPEAVAVGRAAKQAMVKAGIFDAVSENVVTQGLNVVEVGIGVKLRHLDAAVVWDATAHLFREDADRVDIEEAWRVYAPIPVGVLTFSESLATAERFMEFVASKEAAKVFVKHGYGLPPAEAKQGDEA